jgi:nucleotide-binding universal stress UspA family protein
VIALKNILVPTDFSETSEIAVTYAKALAEAFGATIHVLHVFEDPASYLPAEALEALPSFWEDLKRDARKRLDQVLAGPEAQKLDIRRVARMGPTFVEIIGYAKDEAIDLIIMGTHGRGPIRHMLLGSVAEKVVRKAPCPVLTVRPPAHQFVMP